MPHAARRKEGSMNSLIQQILDLEHRAQEMVQTADENSRAIGQSVEKECAAIEADIQKRQKARLEKVEAVENAEAEKQLAGLQKEMQSGLAALSAQFAEKRMPGLRKFIKTLSALKTSARPCEDDKPERL